MKEATEDDVTAIRFPITKNLFYLNTNKITAFQHKQTQKNTQISLNQIKIKLKTCEPVMFNVPKMSSPQLNNLAKTKCAPSLAFSFFDKISVNLIPRKKKQHLMKTHFPAKPKWLSSERG